MEHQRDVDWWRRRREMLHTLVGYSRGCGVDTEWFVIDGDEAFFEITKRLHNRLHGAAGDTGGLGRSEADHYASVMDDNAAALANRVNEGDVVFLHDPQTVGLALHLTQRGARVVWRCHIGTERRNTHTEEGWNFIEGYLRICCARVFSHAGFVPPFLVDTNVAVIAPSIDPYTAKNLRLNSAQIHKLLVRVGLFDDESASGQSVGAVLGGAGPISTDDRVVVQVSRWDHLKDMQGVLEGFADMATGKDELRLALVGPAVDAVSDDPEGAEVLDECMTCWENLSPKKRSAIRLIALPMDDFELNARMVNAIRRYATVVVQKSLEEGFGLTGCRGHVEVPAGPGICGWWHRRPSGSRNGDPSKRPLKLGSLFEDAGGPVGATTGDGRYGTPSAGCASGPISSATVISLTSQGLSM